MGDDLIRHVSDTALWVAACRAIESERPDALFRDPLADRLARSRGRRIARGMRHHRLVKWQVAIRTVVVDGFLASAVADGVDAVLNLGAGLDARPYRMELPSSLRWIEVDHPTLIDDKSADLSEHPSFASWITDYFSPAMRRLRGRRPEMANAPFRFDPPDWERFFGDAGWRLREMRYLIEESLRLGRRPPMPWYVHVLRPVMSEEQRTAMRRMTGYAVLERG